jgi:Zn-dependent M16 (insulinase) family peptidase
VIPAVISIYLMGLPTQLMVFPMQNRLRGSGHGIAAARMDAKLNAAGWITEQMGGVR